MRYTFLLTLLCWSTIGFGQKKDTVKLGHILLLPEVVFEEEKEESERLLIPQQLKSIAATEIANNSPSSTADLLQKSGAVAVQMSQSGGGSPILRGFEANRVLLVVDGVRLNNAIFRSGHLQNIISTSPYSLSRIDVIFGPASVKYGSDALGGVVHLHTKTPKPGEKTRLTYHQKYSSANRGVNSYLDLSWSKGKWSFFHSFSANHYGNLRMGENRMHGYEDWGLEEHVSKGAEQLFTSYQQADLVQKIRYDASNNWSHLWNLQFSRTTDLNRFDKLNDLSGGSPKYSLWKYGPQERVLSSWTAHWEPENNAFFDSFNNNLSLQGFLESRHSQKLGGRLNERFEQVFVIANTTDFVKKWEESLLNYGAELSFNNVESTANEGTASRYADGGSQTKQLSLYSQYKRYLNKTDYLSGGLRYSYNTLDAQFLNTDTYSLPFNQIGIANGAFTASLGYEKHLPKNWISQLSLASGYRAPNVDDVTKVFSKGGTVTVPNDQLKPEYSYNVDVNLSKEWRNKSAIQATAYYTLLKDAILSKAFRLNGADSLWYDEELLPIVAQQNTQEAYVYGWNIAGNIQLNKKWSLAQSVNYTYGWDQTNKSPLDHIPPLYAKSELRWKKGHHQLSCFALYSQEKAIEDYSETGSDNPEEATVDGNPAWWTLNLAYSSKLNDVWTLQFNVENILDTHYKTYSSGLSAPGRNIILSLQASF
jgi:hemoglobin/transferrin/lactoferrin receptor protein